MSRNGNQERRRPSPIAAAAVIATGILTALPMSADAADADTSSPDVATIVTRAAPSLVKVEATGQSERVVPHLPDEALLEHFAERFGMTLPEDFFSRDAPVASIANGIIVSGDGRILTRADQLEGATQVRVTLDDGRQFDAVVLGTDEMTDLAVLKIDASDLPALTFAGTAKAGEPVVAVGARFGSRRDVSSGVISKLGEDAPGAAIFDLVETDAEVGWGNVGGPLLNESGEVVGVNALHVESRASPAGLNVAVPADVAAGVLADISDDGRMDRGFLGVQITPVSDDVTAALGLAENTGAFVVGVGADSPAAEAGLRRGDIVLSVNGTDIRTPRDLTRSIAGDRAGSTVTIQLLRAGQPTTATVTLGNRSA